MGWTDLFQVALLSAAVFFLLGFYSRQWIQRAWKKFQCLFLAPRYLKFDGLWMPTPSTHKKKSDL